jgi:hypothetical protein
MLEEHCLAVRVKQSFLTGGPKGLRFAADKVLSAFRKGLPETLEGQLREATAARNAIPQQTARRLLVFAAARVGLFIVDSFAAREAHRTTPYPLLN